MVPRQIDTHISICAEIQLCHNALCKYKYTLEYDRNATLYKYIFGDHPSNAETYQHRRTDIYLKI